MSVLRIVWREFTLKLLLVKSWTGLEIVVRHDGRCAEDHGFSLSKYHDGVNSEFVNASEIAEMAEVKALEFYYL